MTKLSQLFAISAIAIAVQGCVSDNSVSTQTNTVSESRSSSTFTIPYEKYQLANGLEVVLHQDKSDPVVPGAIQ